MSLAKVDFSLSRLLGVSSLLLLLAGCLSSAGPESPTITEEPKDRVGFVNQEVKFDVGVSGKPPFTFQWLRNGAVIPGANGVTYTTPALTAADEGAKFSVRISNEQGSVTSKEATLTVKPGPSITAQPVAQSVALGSTASFTVAGAGEQLLYQWYRDELPIVGANAATYSFTPTAADDLAVFRAFVINPGGFVVSDPAVLTVRAVPAIAIQPVAQTVAAGDALVLGVVATGGDLLYQWQRNGVDISDATSRVLRVPSVSLADDGASYSVTARNAQGSATSAVVVVNVVEAATASLPQPAAEVAVSDTGVQGGGFVLVRRSTGTVASWGYNQEGQRGDGSAGEPLDTIGTVALPAGRVARSIAAGGAHALALLDDGSVIAWGQNESGQLGLGDVLFRPRPATVTLPRPAVAVAAGRLFSLALLDDGRVYSWGANTIGQLGDGERLALAEPVEVVGLRDVVAIAAGSEHALALKSDGSVWAWGANASGQLGDGSYKASRVPVATGLVGIQRIRAGGSQSFAVSARRVLYTFGESNDGQLGLGELTTDVGVPTAVLRGSVDAAAADRGALVLGADGLLRSAGANEAGSLGDGGTTARRTFGPVSTVSNVISIDKGGRTFAAAINADGTVFVWGDNSTKQFGNSTVPAGGSATPTAVPNFDAIP